MFKNKKIYLGVSNTYANIKENENTSDNTSDNTPTNIYGLDNKHSNNDNNNNTTTKNGCSDYGHRVFYW